ncbi:MAG: hypothetical protein NW206_20065 [Hyphomonadaceae bacterium]|nr:hypothetical protein [Hyphomonadaceae bacterium]
MTMLVIPYKVQPPTHRLARVNRDRSIRALAAGFGSAILAAGRARKLFIEQGGMTGAPPPVVVKPRLDPRLAAVIECAAAKALIGEIGVTQDCDAWAEVVASDPPRLHVFWRGTRIVGDTVATRFVRDKATGLERVAKADGHIVGAHRERDPARFAAALVAVQEELAARGFKPSSFQPEVIATKVPGFEGLVGTIRLIRARPLWLQRNGAGGGRVV